MKTVKTVKSVKTVKTVKLRKAIHCFAVTLVVMMMFVSCDQNDTLEIIDTTNNTDNTDNTEVRFTGGITRYAVLENGGTRAAGSEWTEDDAIGIFMLSYDSSNRIQTVENRQYTTSGDGFFNPVPGNELYYPADGTKVNFIAYYPYTEGAEYDGVHFNARVETVQTAENQQNFDLLYSVNREGYDKTSGPVALQFTHELSKMVLNIVQPSTLFPNNTGITDDDLKDMEISIVGMNTYNIFHFEFGVFNISQDVANITPRTITDGVAYDAIVIPCMYVGDNRIKVEFTLNSTGETFTWNVPDANFISGNQYTYTVSITRRGVEVKGEISDWANNNVDGVYEAD